MEYRAVGHRCAVDLIALDLPISKTQALSILRSKGFEIVDVNLDLLSKSLIGISSYSRGARFNQAPGIVDCSSLIKWLYGKRGIWLPRRTIQQRELGDPIKLGNFSAGDVVFTTGLINYYFDDPLEGVGHAGIVTSEGAIVHAANSKIGIVESSLRNFVNSENFRGARRYIPANREIITFDCPLEREVETQNDIKWILLQSI